MRTQTACVTYDAQADALAIHLFHNDARRYVKTLTSDAGVNVDVGPDDELLSIEVLGVRGTIWESFLPQLDGASLSSFTTCLLDEEGS